MSRRMTSRSRGSASCRVGALGSDQGTHARGHHLDAESQGVELYLDPAERVAHGDRAPNGRYGLELLDDPPLPRDGDALRLEAGLVEHDAPVSIGEAERRANRHPA